MDMLRTQKGVWFVRDGRRVALACAAPEATDTFEELGRAFTCGGGTRLPRSGRWSCAWRPAMP